MALLTAAGALHEARLSPRDEQNNVKGSELGPAGACSEGGTDFSTAHGNEWNPHLAGGPPGFLPGAENKLHRLIENLARHGSAMDNVPPDYRLLVVSYKIAIVEKKLMNLVSKGSGYSRCARGGRRRRIRQRAHHL